MGKKLYWSGPVFTHKDAVKLARKISKHKWKAPPKNINELLKNYQDGSDLRLNKLNLKYISSEKMQIRSQTSFNKWTK
jgi:hypothetical protein